MDQLEPNQGSAIKLILDDEELQVTAIDDLCHKYKEWLSMSKESKGGRKTRSANRKIDLIFDEIMAYKLPPIKLRPIVLSPIKTRGRAAAAAAVAAMPPNRNQSVDSSAESDDDSSICRPITRSLRQRCRTPQQPASRPVTRQLTSPCTPQNQRIRSNLRQTPSGKSSSGSSSSNVLTAALNQQHPSVTVSKIRQLLRPDSAQKKREEEKVRLQKCERMMSDRKAKEERAEHLKRQLLEERAANAKLKREQRLQNAAEVRKKREEARIQQKIEEERAKKLAQAHTTSAPPEKDKEDQPTKAQASHKQDNLPLRDKQAQQQSPPSQDTTPTEQPETANSHEVHSTQSNSQGAPDTSQSSPEKSNKVVKTLNETFKKPVQEVVNIEICIQDETAEETRENNVQPTAIWTRVPHLREALIKQFSKSEDERQSDIRQVFPPVPLPVELDKIFGPSSVARYLKRTSSAQWTPPNRAIKRTSSMVVTPKDDK